MFCNFCGSPVAPEQFVCSRCGSRTTGVLVASAARKRVAEHIHLLAILWFVMGAFFLIPAIVMAVLAAVITAPLVSQGADKIAFVFAPGIFVILCVVFLLSAALRFAAGWGLLKIRPWGRTFALVMAFLALFCPPFDTALGVYTLFVLLPDAAGDEYRQLLQTSTLKTTTEAACIAG
jgi:predicted nucleic acid-binding Zn ribbon protein